MSSAVNLDLDFPNVAGKPFWMLPDLEKDDADLLTEMWKRGRASRHLGDYARFALDVEPALHHRVICEALTDMLLHDTCDVIVVCTPPGAAKSTYTSHALCSFALGVNPGANIILATHTAELSEKWSRKVRNTIASDEHKKVFPASALSKDSTAVSRWATSAGGEFLAAGVGGSILGFRASLCLTEKAIVRTKSGYTSISNIKPGDEVLAYDESQLSTGYYRVVAVAERNADIIYRIHTSDGRVVEATGNHPFYSGGRFVPADTLVVGDSLLSSVWDEQDNQIVGVGQTARQVTVGDGVLLEVVRQQVQSAENHSPLYGLRQSVSSPQQEKPLLFPRLFGIIEQAAAKVVRALRRVVRSAQQQVGVLFDLLQERSPLTTDGVTRQSELAARERPESLQGWKRTIVQGSAEDCPVYGQRGVCDLRQHGKPARASRGWGFDKQHGSQHRDALSVVSYEAAWSGTGETFETTVARIEVVRGDTRVFDIQVEGVANFFANGILVHNCVIDDPINGFEAAQSMTQLEKVHGWYETDLVTRLKPGAKQVIICQRLSPNDLAGYLISRNKNNPAVRMQVLTFRMETEPGDEPDGTGRKPGDRLWPEWFTPEMVEDARRDSFKWQTLYQQRPPSDSGSWVSEAEIGYVDIRPDLDLPRYVVSDLALSVNSGDYSVHLTCAVTATGEVIVEDAWRDRVAVDTTVERHIDIAETLVAEGATLMESLIDDDNASKVYVQLLATRSRQRGVMVPYKPLPLRGQDKETRAAPLRGMFKRGLVKFLRAPWNAWLVKEALVFPNAMGQGVDDGIDALSLIGRRLASLARPAAPPSAAPPARTIQSATLNELWEDRARGLATYGRGRV